MAELRPETDPQARERAASLHPRQYYLPFLSLVRLVCMPLVLLVGVVLSLGSGEVRARARRNVEASGHPLFRSAFERWHFRQSLSWELLYLSVGLLTCGLGLLVFLPMFSRHRVHARHAAEQGEWYRAPWVGSWVPMPRRAQQVGMLAEDGAGEVEVQPPERRDR